MTNQVRRQLLPVLPPLVAVALAFCAYIQTITYEFALDDRHLIVLNSRLSAWHDLVHYFTEAHVWQEGYSAFFRPMMYASLMLNHLISGDQPWSYHLFNVLLHALATLLVYAFARAVSKRIGVRQVLWPFCAAVLFAIHPIHTEAVANVAGRADIMVTCWILSVLVLAPRAYGGSITAAAGICVCAFAAALTKETGCLVVPLLLVWDWSCNRYGTITWSPRVRIWLAAGLGTLTAALMYIAATSVAVTTFRTAFLDNPLADAPFFTRACTSLHVMGKAVWLTCLPYPLSSDYSYAQIVPVDTLLTPLTALGITAIIALLAWSWRLPVTPGKKATELAALWFLVAYIPSSNLLFSIGTIFGERLLYLASVGACLGFGYGIAHLWETTGQPLRRLAPPLALAAVMALAWTMARNSAWRDQSAVRTAMLRTAPRSAKAHFSAAREYAGLNRPREALDAIRTSLSIYTLYPEAHALHGAILIQYRDFSNAWRAAQQAIRLNPHVAEAHYYLGVIAREWGQTNAMAHHFAAAKHLRPQMFHQTTTLPQTDSPRSMDTGQSQTEN